MNVLWILLLWTWNLFSKTFSQKCGIGDWILCSSRAWYAPSSSIRLAIPPKNKPLPWDFCRRPSKPLWSQSPDRILLCRNNHHVLYSKLEQSLWVKGEKTRTLVFYVDLMTGLFQLSSQCRCWYLSPQTESGPVVTSALWTNTQSNWGCEPEVRFFFGCTTFKKGNPGTSASKPSHHPLIMHGLPNDSKMKGLHRATIRTLVS
jgi:hypothetical protein